MGGFTYFLLFRLRRADLDKCSAIIELVDNAVDASATKCNVTIETFDGVQALTVTDDGCGFTCGKFLCQTAHYRALINRVFEFQIT